MFLILFFLLYFLGHLFILSIFFLEAKFQNFKFNEEIFSGKQYLTSLNNNHKDEILKSLDYGYSELQNGFILHSPLEHQTFIANMISDNIKLHFIILYLLIMLFLILSCKFLFNEKIEFTKMEKYHIGRIISYLINKYISI